MQLQVADIFVTRRLHFIINEKMQLVNMVLTGGQVHDSEINLPTAPSYE